MQFSPDTIKKKKEKRSKYEAVEATVFGRKELKARMLRDKREIMFSSIVGGFVIVGIWLSELAFFVVRSPCFMGFTTMVEGYIEGRARRQGQVY